MTIYCESSLSVNIHMLNRLIKRASFSVLPDLDSAGVGFVLTWYPYSWLSEGTLKSIIHMLHTYHTEVAVAGKSTNEPRFDLH